MVEFCLALTSDWNVQYVLWKRGQRSVYEFIAKNYQVDMDVFVQDI